MLKTDEEIKELLLTIRQAVLADSANLFIPDDASFTLRCSTGEKGEVSKSPARGYSRPACVTKNHFSPVI